MAKLPKILLGVLAVLLVAVIGIQLYIAFSNPYVVQTAYKSEINNSFSAKGIICRDETLLTDPVSGAVSYEIRNGDKVAKNSVIAKMYPSEQDIANMAEAARLEEELQTVKESQSAGATAGTQASSLNRQISSVNDEYIGALLSHDISSLYSMKNSFLSSYNRSQILFSDVTDFNVRITALQERINALKAQSGSSVSQIVAPVSGYYVNEMDGYESQVNLENASQLTAEQIEAFFTSEKPVVDENAAGKIITNVQWRYVAVMDGADAAQLKKGSKYGLQFNSSGDETVNATVVSNDYEASKEKAVVIFESDRITENLVKLRLEEAEVVLNTYTGIVIPKSALHIVEGERGVYIKYGQIMQFKLVDILYETEDYFVSAVKETEEDLKKYVRVYDDIIVKGSDFYDGKKVT
ncbi:MAG: HlyD family efflux transporter periplasmic adaptor subunit [Oscillospiraceae bacterium]|jgi:hypothetical protein